MHVENRVICVSDSDMQIQKNILVVCIYQQQVSGGYSSPEDLSNDKNEITSIEYNS